MNGFLMESLKTLKKNERDKNRFIFSKLKIVVQSLTKDQRIDQINIWWSTCGLAVTEGYLQLDFIYKSDSTTPLNDPKLVERNNAHHQ